MGLPRLTRFVLCSVVILSACSCKPMHIHPPVYHEGQVIEGIASWYGRDYHGNPTASGEIYNMYGISAAHRTLPFGTIVKVTRKENGKSVILKINDRGPFIKGREIDLSYGAARVLDMVEDGIAPVQIAILDSAGSRDGSTAANYTLQIGSFVIKTNAERLLQKLRPKYPDVYITIKETRKARYYRVRLGHFSSRKSAEKVASRLRHNGYSIYLTRRDH